MGPNIKKDVLTVSQVIKQLKRIQEEYGDLPVIMETGEVAGSVGHVDVIEYLEDRSKSTVVIGAEYIDSLDNMLVRIK